MADRFKGRLNYVRRILADMYEEAAEFPDGTVGKGTVKFGISDAIDNIDRAAMACP